jgi:beta-lactamase class A
MEGSLREAIAAELAALTCDDAFYYRPAGEPALAVGNCDRFLAACIIKLPILFAWVHLERAGRADRREMCELDLEPRVAGAGLSWLLRTRRLPFGDVLLLMLALSDNLCANLVIRRIGIERLNALFRGPLRLPGVRLERKLMDYEARAAGLDNWVSPADCVRLFELRDELSASERAWIEPALLANTDGGLWLRNVPRDTVAFYHKTGSIPGVLHDWGYTGAADVFLLTQRVRAESEVYGVLDRLGPRLIK